MDQAFSYPYMYWVGMNTAADTDPVALAEFNRHYTGRDLPEVVANNPGFVRGTRYELSLRSRAGISGQGGSPPTRWTARRPHAGTPSATTGLEGRPTYTPGPAAWSHTQTMWRMIWRRCSSTGMSNQAPHSIYLVGMNVPADTDEAGPGGVQRVLHGHPRAQSLWRTAAMPAARASSGTVNFVTLCRAAPDSAPSMKPTSPPPRPIRRR